MELQEIKKKLVKAINKLSKEAGKVAMVIPFSMLYFNQRVYATAGAQATVMAPINTLKTFVLGVIGAAGIILLAFGIFEFASSIQSQDSSQQTAGVKKIIGGILMASVTVIISMLGF